MKDPTSRLGAQNIEDLKDHKFFEGIDFSTIHDQLPPVKLELTENQAIVAKYLPHNKLAGEASSPQVRSVKSHHDFRLSLKKLNSTQNLITTKNVSEGTENVNTNLGQNRSQISSSDSSSDDVSN